MIISSPGDYREAARRKLPPFLFHYIDGGAYAEQTLRRNVEDWQAIALRQRVAQQQQVVQAYKTRDAQMAAMLRSMAYGGRGGVGGAAGPRARLRVRGRPRLGGRAARAAAGAGAPRVARREPDALPRGQSGGAAA